MYYSTAAAEDEDGCQHVHLDGILRESVLSRSLCFPSLPERTECLKLAHKNAMYFRRRKTQDRTTSHETKSMFTSMNAKVSIHRDCSQSHPDSQSSALLCACIPVTATMFVSPTRWEASAHTVKQLLLYVYFPLSQPHTSLNLRLDDALFQRLVESRWDGEQQGGPLDGSGSGNNGRKGVDFDGFARIYRGAATPATTFGRHLRKAAGRGEEELGETT